jgi:hypothetical protein
LLKREQGHSPAVMRLIARATRQGRLCSPSMIVALQVASVFLVSVAMALALAHALELPGKLRLDRDSYCELQLIYYPGFTYGGFGEVLALFATLALLLVTRDGAAFRWTLAGFVALLAMHAIYWTVTHPVNRFWLKDQDLTGFGKGFFGFDPLRRHRDEASPDQLWRRLRDRWEYSHVARAILSAIALIALLIAVAIS